jgi:hypothetical protein
MIAIISSEADCRIELQRLGFSPGYPVKTSIYTVLTENGHTCPATGMFD